MRRLCGFDEKPGGNSTLYSACSGPEKGGTSLNNGQPIQRVAVLGAGVMGTQIAALLANAGIDVDLLDIPAAADPAARARSGIEGALKSRPPAFFWRQWPSA
ncbi:MAG: hypothetical protein CME16_02570 [Gemmatimonadetes bacterium]|nr:hypothetical protein [Gemmatimonadota bacterium]